MCLLVSFRGASRQVLPGELSPAVLSIYSKLSKSNKMQMVFYSRKYGENILRLKINENKSVAKYFKSK